MDLDEEVKMERLPYLGFYKQKVERFQLYIDPTLMDIFGQESAVNFTRVPEGVTASRA